MGWQVVIAPSARGDLESIVRYIASHDADAAARIGYELIVRVERLAVFPEMGRMVPEFHQPNLRQIIHRSYRIIYRIRSSDRCVEIVRFWHGARGMPQAPPEGPHERTPPPLAPE